MSVELREAPRCINCGCPLTISAHQTQVTCPACSCRMEIAAFTQEERRLAEIIQDAARQMEQAAQQPEDGRTLEEIAGIQAQLQELEARQRTAQAHRLQKRFELAESAQRRGRYQEAIGHYQELLQDEGSQEAELHWRIVMCRYGVEYVYEQDSGCYLPTITNMLDDSVLEDPDYLAAVLYARSDESRAYYEAQARELDRILRTYRDVCAEQRPYDVFISVKQGDEQGNPTDDSLAAMELYMDLTQRGLHVFNSRKSLEGCAGLNYEPYIMAALRTSKVMIVMGSTAAYLEAPWVANEWRRFRWLQEHGDGQRRLIPYLIGLPASQLPSGLSGMQAISTRSLDPLGRLYDVLGGVFGSRFDAQKREEAESQRPEERHACPFCGTETSAPPAAADLCCPACGNRWTPPEGQTDCVQYLQEALSLREQRAFGESAERYAAIRTLYPGSHQALMGELLARLQVAYVPVGRDPSAGLKPQLCAAPQEDALAVLDDAIRRMSVHTAVPAAERESCLTLLQHLRDMVDSCLQAATGPAWDVLICCPPEDRAQAQEIRELLDGWGCRAFLADPGLRGAAARAQESQALHAAFTARAMLAVSATAEGFYQPGMMNEALRTAGEIIPLALAPEVEIPAEFNPFNALIWDEEAPRLLFEDLTRLLPDRAACSHEGLLLEIWQGSAGRIVRRCVRCGCIRPAAQPVTGEDSARAMQRCLDGMQRCDYPAATLASREAIGLLRTRMAAADAETLPKLQAQRMLMSFMNFSAGLGLRLYRAQGGWQPVIGVKKLPDRTALDNCLRALKEPLDDQLGDVLDAAHRMACAITERRSLPHADVALTLRLPADGGDGDVLAFARMLTGMMRERGLLVNSAADLGERSCWGFREEEQHAAAFGSPWLLALTGSAEDTASAEIRKQTDRLPQDARMQFLELAAGAAQGQGNSKHIVNCDEANASMLADQIRLRCANYYKRRIATMWPSAKDHMEELRWSCERGMSLAAGNEMREFQYQLAVLYGWAGSPFHDAARSAALLSEAARYGNAAAIELCRKRGVRY